MPGQKSFIGNKHPGFYMDTVVTYDTTNISHLYVLA